MKSNQKIIIGIVIFVAVAIFASIFFPNAMNECIGHCPMCIKAPCPCPCQDDLGPINATRHIWAPILISIITTAIYGFVVFRKKR